MVIVEEFAALALAIPGYYQKWELGRLREEMWADVQLGQFITTRGMGDRLLGFATFWRISRELAEELEQGYFRPPPEHLNRGQVGVLSNICAVNRQVARWLTESLRDMHKDAERILAWRHKNGLVRLVQFGR